MKKRVILAILVPVFGLVGCAPQTPYDKYKAGQALQNFPYKAGTTQAQTEKAVTDCQIEAAQRVPQQMVVQTTPTYSCLLYTSPSPRDRTRSRMPSSA